MYFNYTVFKATVVPILKPPDTVTSESVGNSVVVGRVDLLELGGFMTLIT